MTRIRFFFINKDICFDIVSLNQVTSKFCPSYQAIFLLCGKCPQCKTNWKYLNTWKNNSMLIPQDYAWFIHLPFTYSLCWKLIWRFSGSEERSLRVQDTLKNSLASFIKRSHFFTGTPVCISKTTCIPCWKAAHAEITKTWKEDLMQIN